MFNTTQDEQNQKMRKALQDYYTNRGLPKPPAPVNNELADFHLAMEQHAARENAKQRADLEAAFAKRAAMRAAKTK